MLPDRRLSSMKTPESAVFMRFSSYDGILARYEKYLTVHAPADRLKAHSINDFKQPCCIFAKVFDCPVECRFPAYQCKHMRTSLKCGINVVRDNDQGSAILPVDPVEA